MNRIAAFQECVASSDPEGDAAAVLRVHSEWWTARRAVDPAEMMVNFPAGPNYLVFDLHGHPYYGIEEEVRLWEHNRTESVEATGDTRIIQFDLDGDMAWLAAEVLLSPAELDEKSDSPAKDDPRAGWRRVRSTECYRRSGGASNVKWRMWHLHCSPLPHADAARPPFGDTARDRGELIP